jgi:protein O-mannosyl-transferase
LNYILPNMPLPTCELTSSRTRLWICLGLVAITLAVYWPVTRSGFINFDDPDYVTQNAYVQSGLTWPGVGWAFRTGHSANWHPLSWLSHMLDVQLFGLNGGAHHLVNLLFHIANTLLLFLLFQKLTGATWRSAFVAALFAVHPLHVESVAWVAERKDVLSTFFGLLSIGAYAACVGKSEGRSQKSTVATPEPNVQGPNSAVGRPGSVVGGFSSLLQLPSPSLYVLSLVLFTFSLMSKPMLVTLPFLLLLLDYWPLRRFEPSTINKTLSTFWCLLREKIPYLALAIVSSAITVVVQKQGHALLSVEAIPIGPRVANALVSYVRYIGKSLWPSHLVLPYPYPSGWPLAVVALAALLMVGLSLVALRLTRSRPYVAVGWFWFVGTLAPVIGLVQVGPQAMADRYTYIPLIGLFILVAWLVPDWLRNWRYRQVALGTAGSAIILLCLGLARVQAGYWKDSETLFRHALRVTRDNYVAHDNLGDALADQGKREEARAEFTSAIKIKPGFAHAYSNLAKLAFGEGKFEAAANWFRQALELNPDNAEIHSNLAAALASQNRPDEANSHYLEAIRLQPDRFQAHSDLAHLLLTRGKLQQSVERGLAALRLKPDSAETHFQVGNALFLQGKLEPAVGHYRAALKSAPDSAAVRLSLGKALAGLKHLAEAEAQLREALRLQPGNPDAHQVLATIYKAQNRFREVRSEYEAVLRLVPDWPEVLNNLAWLLATQPSAELRDGARAVTLAGRACQLTGSTNLWLLSTLAAAYAEAGRYPEAVSTQQKVCDLAAAQGPSGAAESFQTRLGLYRSGQPYRLPAANP